MRDGPNLDAGRQARFGEANVCVAGIHGWYALTAAAAMLHRDSEFGSGNLPHYVREQTARPHEAPPVGRSGGGRLRLRQRGFWDDFLRLGRPAPLVNQLESAL